MSTQATKRTHTIRFRRLAAGANSSLAVVLAALLLLMVNYLSYRHYSRTDWSQNQYYSLSGQTLNLLKNLDKPVRVIVFIPPGSDVYDDVINLLTEYQYGSSKILVERVDPDRDLARAEELSTRYDVHEAEMIVFECEGRRNYVRNRDLYESDADGDSAKKPARAFAGERAFTTALQQVLDPRRSVVYFLQGHGERDPEDADPRRGYSGIVREMSRDNIEVRKLLLGQEKDIPEDADMLVIAAPTRPLHAAELERVERYLEHNGRALILLDALQDGGLVGLLRRWSVQVAHDLVVDGSRTLTGRELFLTEYAKHPVTEGLQGITSIFHLPRSVEPIVPHEGNGNADRPHAVTLAASSESGWAETDLEQSPLQFDPGTDRPGPVGVAVASEKGPVPGLDVDIQPSRLVVFGDSDFVSNGGLSGGDADFFMGAVNWLLDRNDRLGIRPRIPAQAQLVIDAPRLRTLFVVVVFIIPLAPALLGLIVWSRRRR